VPHKISVELKNGKIYRDSGFHDGRTPQIGEEISVKVRGQAIRCRVRSVHNGTCKPQKNTFEAVDDVQAKEE
jgi:hypothetical protein